MISTVDRGRADEVEVLKLPVLLLSDVDDSVGAGSKRLRESARGFDSRIFSVLSKEFYRN